MEAANVANSGAVLKEKYDDKFRMSAAHYADGGGIQPSAIPSADLPPGFQLEGGAQQQQTLPSSSAPTTTTSNDSALPEGFQLESEAYSTPEQLARTFGEGVASGASFGLSGLLEGEESRRREEQNPITRELGEAAGLVGSSLTGVGEGALVAKAGEMALEKAGLTGAKSIAQRFGSAAVRNVVEGTLIGVGNETDKLLRGDPDQTVGTAAANIGLSGLLGGTLGVAGEGAAQSLGAVTRRIADGKLGQIVSDFGARVKQHMETPNPVETMTGELGGYYKGITDLADDVYGPQGLKAQEVAKLVPKELTPKITDQLQTLSGRVDEKVGEMMQKTSIYPERLTVRLANDADAFRAALQDSTASPNSLFDAAQNLKQKLQGYAKYEKMIKPVDEAYDFVRASKDLAYDFRNALEDSSVWGDAANRQKSINKGFTEFLPTLNDFNKRFTTEQAGERVIDPGKIATYLNQLGKPSSEIKQSMLSEFLDAADKYRSVIEQTHANLGLEPPIQPSPTSFTRGTLNELPPGAKLADKALPYLINKAGGTALGGATGAAIGSAFGHPELGAILGGHALGPAFGSVLSAVVKPLIEKTVSGQGFRAVAEYGAAAAKGEQLLSKASKSLFKGVQKAVVDYPTERDRNRLDNALMRFKTNPELLPQLSNQSDYYLPGHGVAMGRTTASAVNYLNSLRPDDSPAAPLDSRMPANDVKKAQYNRALDIAEKPLIVLDMLRKGTLLPQDLQALQTMYPGLYQRMNEKLIQQVVDTKTDNGFVPYKTRLGISMFTGQSMDSTMMPASIIAAQSISSSKATAPAGAAPVKAKRSTAPLAKLPGQFQTSLQARQQKESSRD